MSRVSKLVVAAAVAIAGLASPALAQSFDPDVGTGNVVSLDPAPSPVRNQTTAMRRPDHSKLAMHRSGVYDFAMVMDPLSNGISFGPALTGGGSRGYNEALLRDF
jgi:hypothetical protein